MDGSSDSITLPELVVPVDEHCAGVNIEYWSSNMLSKDDYVGKLFLPIGHLFALLDMGPYTEILDFDMANSDKVKIKIRDMTIEWQLVTKGTDANHNIEKEFVDFERRT